MKENVIEREMEALRIMRDEYMDAYGTQTVGFYDAESSEDVHKPWHFDVEEYRWDEFFEAAEEYVK